MLGFGFGAEGPREGFDSVRAGWLDADDALPMSLVISVLVVMVFRSKSSEAASSCSRFTWLSSLMRSNAVVLPFAFLLTTELLASLASCALMIVALVHV